VSEEAIIEVRDLVVKYGEKTVLDGLSFDIMRGETFVILGGSGSGKSTLLRNLVGLKRPSAGRIVVDGKDFTAMDDKGRVEMRKRMGMCFQGSALFNSMSVAENVAMPLLEHTELAEETVDIMVKIKLGLVGLEGAENLLPSELSGGMKKRAGFARAMAMDPEIIFYDEPSAGLDPIVAAGIDELIVMLKETYSLTSVVVTHELASVEIIADRACILHSGKIAAIGTLDDVRASDDEYVRSFFERKPDAQPVDNEQYLKSLTDSGGGQKD
jgi:phospholipid/cholesterol/gamma-HCH transport system ATP-binding protein